MFQSLKQKIAKETGQDITKLNYTKATTSSISNSARNSLSSNHSHSLDSSKDELSVIEEKDSEIAILRQELAVAQTKIKVLEEEKKNLELSKDLIYDETEKIQNAQFHEIEKLKSLLVFREQESLDQLNKSRNDENQIEGLKSEIARIKNIEEVFENLQDEYENLRRSTQLEKNQLITKLSAQEEEIRHLKAKLEIAEQRAQITSSDTENDKIRLLLQERKMLESRLEEAHIHLYEIKSNWTSQNLTLENQLQRLSRQVAEETAEKRKIVETKEILLEKNKQLEFELLKATEELKARDNKIKLMNEEIDELNTSLRELQTENEEEIEFLRSKVAYQESELNQTKESVMKFSESSEEYEKQILALQRENNEMIEKLKNAENKIIELSERIEIVEKENSIISDLQAQVDKFEAEVADKNKAIKILNQRLFDVKKTLNEEIKNKSIGSTGSMTSKMPAILVPVNVDNNSNHQTMPFNLKKNSNSISEPIVFDCVKFSYLKHVIFKFLTTESKHLIKPVSTLLYLNDTEEKLLEEVLDYRKSWFGKPPSSMSMSAL
ncbi:hypothetical protein PVAND_009163 [Polypedilum vanderplanki]|uniref:GRIP domain-containing protein n=1 Tax=Polypedilum vanderplanki TaxID=319348 RepID=A0A9J6CCY2_POLVA|nr:hypothetical protein PVAND_009163 [Polypedilum vanderplanki]